MSTSSLSSKTTKSPYNRRHLVIVVILVDWQMESKQIQNTQIKSTNTPAQTTNQPTKQTTDFTWRGPYTTAKYIPIDFWNNFIINTIKLNCKNVIWKRGSVFEVSQKNLEQLCDVHTGRIIRSWNTQSEKRFMQKRLSDCNRFAPPSLKPHSLEGIVSPNVTHYQQLEWLLPSKFLCSWIFWVITKDMLI